MKIAFLGNSPSNVEAVYSEEQRNRLGRVLEVVPGVIGSAAFESMLPVLKDVEAVFSTWGMFRLDDAQVARMPALKLLLYGAGSVQGFARPFLKNGVRISGGWRTNGQSVAEFALAQIILACKGYFRNVRQYRDKRSLPGVEAGAGLYRETVALLGGGAIARRLIGLLKHTDLNVMLYDPYVDEFTAAQLGARKATLEQCFETACVVSNHMPSLDSTKDVLTETLFAAMRKGATFINTGRAASVQNDGFVKVFSERPDLTALLDVTQPEPLTPDSPIFNMSNVQVSTHISGAIHTEKFRIGDKMIEAFYEWVQHGTVRDEITLEMLDTMA